MVKFWKLRGSYLGNPIFSVLLLLFSKKRGRDGRQDQKWKSVNISGRLGSSLIRCTLLSWPWMISLFSFHLFLLPPWALTSWCMKPSSKPTAAAEEETVCAPGVSEKSREYRPYFLPFIHYNIPQKYSGSRNSYFPLHYRFISKKEWAFKNKIFELEPEEVEAICTCFS